MTVRLIVLGTGSMANNHAEAFKAIEGVEIVGGVDTRPVQLEAFCDKHQIPNRFATLDEAIAWGEFDAATNVTPDSAHYATTMALLKAGKHVLCEKPLSTDYAKAKEMADAAKAAGVVNMVNLSYRNGAALQRAAEMVAKGMIGPVRHFEAQYLQSWLTQAAWGDWRTEPQWLWRLSSKHGSKGVLGDVGIHILDYATFVAGSFPVSISGRLKTFDKAEGNRIGEYDLDVNDSFVCHLELASGAMGTITATRFASGHHNDLKLSIYGDGGGLEVRYIQHESKLLACLGSQDMATQTWREIETPEVKKVYEVFIEAINGDGPMNPDFERGAALQFLLDAAEESDRQKGASVEVNLGA